MRSIPSEPTAPNEAAPAVEVEVEAVEVEEPDAAGVPDVAGAEVSDSTGAEVLVMTPVPAGVEVVLRVKEPAVVVEALLTMTSAQSWAVAGRTWPVVGQYSLCQGCVKGKGDLPMATSAPQAARTQAVAPAVTASISLQMQLISVRVHLVPEVTASSMHCFAQLGMTERS
jgi:hypothetical protein